MVYFVKEFFWSKAEVKSYGHLDSQFSSADGFTVLQGSDLFVKLSLQKILNIANLCMCVVNLIWQTKLA